MLIIDGQKMPKPTSYQVTISDLDSSDSVRNELGILMRNRIRQGATKVAVGYIVSGADASKILGATKPEKVSVEYYDPEEASVSTMQAYVSDRTCSVKVYQPEMNISEIWWEITFSLIEY